MSDTKKQPPTNVMKYMAFGVDKVVKVERANEQLGNVNDIPGIPMEINVDTHNCEIAPNGEIIRRDSKTKQVMPGKVTDKKVADTLKKQANLER